MADGRHGFTGVDEVAHESDRRSVQPQLVGIDRPTGPYKSVELVDGCLLHRLVDANRAGRLQIVLACLKVNPASQ